MKAKTLSVCIKLKGNSLKPLHFWVDSWIEIFFLTVTAQIHIDIFLTGRIYDKPTSKSCFYVQATGLVILRLHQTAGPWHHWRHTGSCLEKCWVLVVVGLYAFLCSCTIEWLWEDSWCYSSVWHDPSMESFQHVFLREDGKHRIMVKSRKIEISHINWRKPVIMEVRVLKMGTT